MLSLPSDPNAQAFDILMGVVKDIDTLSLQVICEIHDKLLNNSPFMGGRGYALPEETRTSTGQSVLVSDSSDVQCCPYLQVDNEMNFIVRRAKVWCPSEVEALSLIWWLLKKYMNDGFHNPFATAGWLHSVLTTCHPFNVSEFPSTRKITSPLTPTRMGTAGCPD